LKLKGSKERVDEDGFFMEMEVSLNRVWLTVSKGDSYKVLGEHSQNLELRHLHCYVK